MPHPQCEHTPSSGGAGVLQLGKAYLKQGKLAEARREFAIVAAQPGDLLSPAAGILARLPKQ